MAVRVRLLRPDDLLNLEVEGINLHLDTGDGIDPRLIVDDRTRPAFLAVHLPPQTIVEEAYYQSSPTPPPPSDATKPYNKPPSTAGLQVPSGLARARIGRPSRLVFKVPDGVRIPYTTEGLLDWRGLELSVSGIADLPDDPTPQQVIAAPNITAPAAHETSLEIPYQLVLSPRHGVAWDHALGLKTHAGRTELWHTRLAHVGADGEPTPTSRLNPAPLRAIWSPDYNPNRFGSTDPLLDNDPPLMGRPDLDWDYPPGVLTAMTPSDRHEIVILTSAFRGFVKGYRDDLTIDFHRYLPKPVHAEQLILSPLGGWLKSRGAWRPPMHWRLVPRIELPSPVRHFDELIGRLRPLRPEGRQAPAGSAAPEAGLAGHDAALARAVAPAGDFADLQGELLANVGSFDSTLLGELGSSLNISEWVHVATAGRDHYVRIVYEGILYPCRHRAALVKVTERRISNGASGAPIAFLAQRMFIVVRQPELNYDPERVADPRYGRHMPLRRLRLTTLITPDIDLPTPIAGAYTFEIRVGSQPFRFTAVGTDIGGNHVDCDPALIFIPFSDINAGTVAAVRAHYLAWEARPCAVPGQQVTYAERSGVPGPGGRETDNTTLTTRVLHFSTADAPGGLFLPLLFKSEVKLPAVEQLLGTDAPAQIAYDSTYLDQGFGGANVTGLFAHIAKESPSHVLSVDKLGAKFAADQAGGISTPDLSISALTRQLGPLAGDNFNQLRGNTFDAGDFFKDVKNAAKLFGTIPLVDLIEGGRMDDRAPKIELATEPVPGSLTKRKLIAQLHWHPRVREVTAGIVVFHPQPATELGIDGRVERIVEVPPAGAPGPTTSRFEGKLTNFTIELLNVVEVFFDSFQFVAEGGRKPDVNIALRDPDPLEFKGDLAFVNELKSFIPPGLFGEGASLDISPTRIKAGFGIGLPPVAIGVFSLQGVSLNASVELPFLNGQPLFDFGISSREHPFCLTVAFLGGGGFFHLQVDTEGVRLLEAALEFGACASIDLGVASGGVHIMAGIYFAMGTKNGKEFAVLAGYLRMGGELSVLGLISISLEFVLSFAYEDGKAAGRATLTVKVEIAFFSTSVEISVEKKFGGSSGDPRFFEVFERAEVWDEYASAFA